MSNKIDSEKTKAFLKDLTELSRKHGIYIGGCGCCESPYLRETKDLQAEDFYRVSETEEDGWSDLRFVSEEDARETLRIEGMMDSEDRDKFIFSEELREDKNVEE